MNSKSLVVSAAIGSLLALGAATANAGAHAAKTDKEKCYGVAMAGQNDCAANGHSCAGQSKTDKDPTEWKYVEAGKCAEMGGTTKDAPKAM
jgi:uncharacterized membrane protein